jgi:hypothetical protein
MMPQRLPKIVALSLTAVFVTGALLTFLADAGRQAGHWGASEFQLQSLWPVPVSYTAQLLDLQGSAVWSATGALAPYAALNVQPASLPPGFTGTLVVQTSGFAPGAIAHLEQAPDEIGSEIYEMRDEDEFQPDAWLVALERDTRPGRGSSAISIRRQSATSGTVTATLWLYSTSGAITPTATITLGLSAQLNLGDPALPLPPVWSGAGRVQASAPVQAYVLREDGGSLNAYPGASATEAATELLLPWVAPSQAGLVTSTVVVVNPGATTALVSIRFGSGNPSSFLLAPHASGRVPGPVGAFSPVSASISGNVPLVALTRMLSSGQGREGTLSYSAVAVAQLARTQVLPLLYEGDLGWTHQPPAGAVRVYNAGHVTATVQLVYRSAGANTVVAYAATLGPGAFTDDYPPPGAGRWSLQAGSSEPVAVVAVGFRQVTALDHWYAYRGLPYVSPRVPLLMLPVSFYNP